MYKIFINDKPFIITNCSLFDNYFPTYKFEEQIFENKIKEALSNNFNGIVFKAINIEYVFEIFSKHFTFIEAAGGLVFNNYNELLLIKRLGVWDLPKGKIEIGETAQIAAIREVEEECGINGLTIKNELPNSYHVYAYKGKFALKRTYWYIMHSNFSAKLIPQIEENITQVEWYNLGKADIQKLDTYESIKEVLENCFSIGTNPNQ